MQEFIDKYAEKLGVAILQHIGYVLVSVGIAVVIALVLAGALSRIRKAARVIIPVIDVYKRQVLATAETDALSRPLNRMMFG